MSTVLNIDVTGIDPSFGFAGGFFPKSPPNGWLCRITADGGFVPASTGKGAFLALELTGMEGPVEGTTATLRLNLQHEEPKAVKAAFGQMSAIGHVVGVMRIGTVNDIMNKPFRVVSVEQKQTDADAAAGKTPFTQLADDGIRDINGNKPGKAGAGPQVGQPAPVAPVQPVQPQISTGPALDPNAGNQQWGGGPANTGAPAGQPAWGGPATGGAVQGDPNAQPAGGQPAWGGAPANGGGGQWAGAPAGGGQPAGGPAWGGQQ